MRRKTRRSFYATLAAIALVSSAIFIMGRTNYAAGVTTPVQVSPGINATFQSNSQPIQFKTYANYGTWAQVKTNVMYRRVGEDRWHSFGTTASTDPQGRVNYSIPNGFHNAYISPWGWNCAMGWGSTPPPSSCDIAWSSGGKSGKPAWPNTTIYNPTINFEPGTYEWSVQARDIASGSVVSGWTGTWRFTVNSSPVPPPPPPPPPPPEPLPEGPTDDYGTSENTTNQPENITEPIDDKEPPSIPTDLKGEYSAEESSINLSWTAATDNVSVIGYEIERRESTSQDWKVIDSTENENYSDFLFEPQKIYRYRIRAFDQVKNYSGYSSEVEVNAGAFSPNVTVKDGGNVSDQDNMVSAEFSAGAVAEDLFVSIEKSDNQKIPLDANLKSIGSTYEVRAKNSSGTEVTQFKTQIKLKMTYKNSDSKGSNTGTLQMATYNPDEDKVVYLKTKSNAKDRSTETLTDHLSIYFLVAEKSSPWLTFLRILLWILIIIAIGFVGYFGWMYFQKKKYQKEHREDYIYKH